ncbi:MAG: DUF6768 family protein [Planctomycetota bacterium]
MMDDLDEKILAALKAEDVEVLSQYEGESSLPTSVMQVYTGRRRWINLSATVVTFAVFALQVWCGYRFFNAETTRELIGWATGFLTLFVWVVMMKLWFWLEMLRNSVTREVKRLELQVALLNQRQETTSTR